MTIEVYAQAAIEQVPRLVSLLDRNPHSGTRGSFSRTHWGWKFTDFPFPRFQEGACALARLYDLDAPGNTLFRSPMVETWVAWALEYWITRQHRDGSFDEAYPFERSFAATAFTSFYIGSIYERWRERLSPDLSRRVAAALVLAGEWLNDNDETHGILSNHLAVAAAALQQTALTFDRPHLAQRARVFIDRILAHQSPEGWTQEYSGADAGYGSHGFFYLAAYWHMTRCEQTQAALDRFAGFLAHCVHPDGTLGGEYGSRDTEFYYPAGFEMLAALSPMSAAIATTMRASLAERRVCGVGAMDEFNLMPMLNNLLFAAEHAAAIVAPPRLPFQDAPFRRYLPSAGLWIVNTPDYYAIVGVSKGGTVSLFDKATRSLAARHSGLIVERAGERFTSQDYRLSPPAAFDAEGASLTTTVQWKSLSTKSFGSPLFLAFRLFTLSIGRLPGVARWLKHTLVRVLITEKRRPAVHHQRTVSADAVGIRIVDELQLPWNDGELQAASQFTTIHMGSALYADRRTTGPERPVQSWPLRRRMTVSALLTPSGASWKADPA